MEQQMAHGSLFSGIGGFDLAAEWVGWQNIFHCEWNEFGQKVLKHYWPKATSYADITKTDFTIHRGTIDVLTGGFPCQPYSLAGQRLGKEDDRHLWPEMLRAVREIRPGWVVGENVRGLINWNGGLVFHEVQTDLEAEGYEVFPFLLPAAGVNAPHERYRIWFIAYCANSGPKGLRREWEDAIHGSKASTNPENFRQEQPWNSRQRRTGFKNHNCDNSRVFTNAHGIGLWGQSNGTGESGQPNQTSAGNNWQDFPTQPPVCNGNDGLPAKLDGITFSKWRNESIKAGGNAIVPQVAYQIFQAIIQIIKAA